MRVDPTYDCAVHTAHRLRFLRDGDARHLIALADFMRDSRPSSTRPLRPGDCCEDRDWLGLPAGTTEACVNGLYQIPADQRATAKITRLSWRPGGTQRAGHRAAGLPGCRDRVGGAVPAGHGGTAASPPCCGHTPGWPRRPRSTAPSRQLGAARGPT